MRKLPVCLSVWLSGMLLMPRELTCQASESSWPTPDEDKPHVDSKSPQNRLCATLHPVREMWGQWGLPSMQIWPLCNYSINNQATSYLATCCLLRTLLLLLFSCVCVCVLCILLMKSSTVVHVQSIIHSNQKPRCSVASQFSLTWARSPCEGRP